MNEHQEIIDYLASTPDIPADLLKAIHQWLSDHGGEAATTGAILTLWENIGASLQGDPRDTIDPDMAKGLQRILREIDTFPATQPASPLRAAIETQIKEPVPEMADDTCEPQEPRHPHYKWLFIAATVCVLLSVGSFILGNRMASPQSDTVLLAAEGSIGRYTLPDGTRIWLNGGSTLTYAGNFDDGAQRKVSIDGEAYFEVTRNPRRPFIVEMESMNVKVLGTSFSARSCSYASSDEVVLLSGKVEVESSWLPDPLVIRPDQKVTLDRESHHSIVEPANARAYCRWIQPVTTFDNEPLSDILILLSRRYGLEMHSDSPELADARLSITINASQSLDEIISIIEHLLPVRLSVDDRQLTLAAIGAR